MENLLIADREFNHVMDDDAYGDAMQKLLERIGEVRDLYEKELGPIIVGEDHA